MNDVVIYDNKEILVMDNIPPFCEEEYNLMDKDDFKKYVSDGERLIRNSFEYRQFINYLRDYMNMNKCSFFENVTNQDTFKIKIHIHHCPFTLYEIFLTVYNKRMFMREPLDIELVAEEVLYIHYFLMVGLIPLAETVHDLVHKQVLFIPLNKVMGNYEVFEETYAQFIPEESKNKLAAMKKQTELYNEAANLAILEQRPLYIQLQQDGSYKIPTVENMEKLIDVMFNRIKEIKEEASKKMISTNENIYDNNVEMKNVLYHVPKENKMIDVVYHVYK